MSIGLPDGVDRRRGQKNIFYALLISLFVLWTIKLASGSDTAARLYTSTASTIYNSETSLSAPSAAQKKVPAIPAKPTADFESLYNGTIRDKVAIIIEDRPRANLVPIILHFSSVLGPTWPIIIYTSLENVQHFQTSAPLRRYITAGIIQVRLLPSSVIFANSGDFSKFLTLPWVWEQLAPASHVLLFQADSMLCSNAARSVEDFFEYDFVGAPIREGMGPGMNGGLSLRKRETMLRIVNEFEWEKVGNPGRKFEDMWFYDRLLEIRQREIDEPWRRPENVSEIRIPDMEVARMFSVESIDFPHPLGVHQVGRFLDAKSLDDWCPEYKLCSGDRINI